jgi:hypothetical protein
VIAIAITPSLKASNRPGSYKRGCVTGASFYFNVIVPLLILPVKWLVASVYSGETGGEKTTVMRSGIQLISELEQLELPPLNRQSADQRRGRPVSHQVEESDYPQSRRGPHHPRGGRKIADSIKGLDLDDLGIQDE